MLYPGIRVEISLLFWVKSKVTNPFVSSPSRLLSHKLKLEITGAVGIGLFVIVTLAETAGHAPLSGIV